MSPYTLIGKKYDEKKYNCLHFVEEILGYSLGVPADVLRAKELMGNVLPNWVECTPYNLCVVKLGSKHIGLYYDGYIFHNDNLNGHVVASKPNMVKYKITYMKEIK